MGNWRGEAGGVGECHCVGGKDRRQGGVQCSKLLLASLAAVRDCPLQAVCVFPA